MRIDRHVFGSFKGYATLGKSDGVSAEDARQLEGAAYGFGQTEDRKYLKCLRTRPAYFTRSLRGNRRCLTRVLEGAPDDNGRPTLLMVTAVVSTADFDGVLGGDVGPLLDDSSIWEWGGEATLVPLDRDLSAPTPTVSKRSVPRLIALISELERRYPNVGQVVLSSDEFDEGDIRMLAALLPPTVRSQITVADRSLSPQLAVNVNRLAAEAPQQKVTYRTGSGAPPSPYATFVSDAGLASGRIPVAEVMTYREFGRIRGSGSASGGPTVQTYAPPPPPVAKGIPWAKWGGVATLVVAAFAGGVAVGRLTAKVKPMESIAAKGPTTHPTTATSATSTAKSSSTAVASSQSTAPLNAAPVDRVIAASGPSSKDHGGGSLATTVPATIAGAPTTKEVRVASVAASQPTTGERQSAAAPASQSAPASESPEDLIAKVTSSAPAQMSLLKHWDTSRKKFAGQPIRFGEEDGADIDLLEKELNAANFGHAIFMTNNDLALLPMLIEIRKKYVELDQRLRRSDKRNPDELAKMRTEFEELVNQARAALDGPSTRPSPRDVNPFYYADEILNRSQNRLAREKGGPTHR